MLSSFISRFLRIERPGALALQTLRDVKKYHECFSPWSLAQRSALHIRIAVVEQVPRVLSVPRLTADEKQVNARRPRGLRCPRNLRASSPARPSPAQAKRQEDFVKGNGKAIDLHEKRALKACMLQRLALKLGPRGLRASYGEEQEARSPLKALRSQRPSLPS